jgi:Transposase DDE domain group 1
MTPDTVGELTFLGRCRQPLSVVFDGPDIVTDTGLLALRDLDQRLGYLTALARRLPDPRAQDFVTHPLEDILIQQVYQFLADCADCNDADRLRHDTLFRTLVGRDPDDQRPLACGSTLARFQYAFTRRQLQLPEEDRPAFREMYQARSQRLSLINQFLVDTFIRTRTQVPTHVIIDLDPTDDPTHGRQALTRVWHG